MTTSLIGSRYEPLERLGAGGMGEVWRVRDRLSGGTVALKRVRGPAIGTGDATAGRTALEHEFRALSSLRHPGIVGVLDYGFTEEGEPFFTMELLEGARTILEAAAERPQEARIDLLFQLLEALSYLHRRGVLHRDLKPSNILVSEGRVRLVDFGLAASRSESDASSGGTLAYLAPEVLRGRPHGPESELYAVGVVAYQMLAGRHPFEGGPVRGLLHRVLHTFPELSRLGLDPRVSGILARLLSKDPADRYPDAGRLAEAFAEATRRPLPVETEAIRESYLRRATFVGRGAELARLSGALAAALQGAGSGWLLAGESGAGKSRLLDEIRGLALVRGALVLRGQAAEGAAPYATLADAVLQLCLRVPPLEEEGSVLQAAFPALPRVLGRDFPDARPLDPVGTAARLAEVVQALLRRSAGPVVLQLDDCHLLRDELHLVGRLSQIAHELPLLILAAYQPEERPGLAAELPDMRELTLGPLDAGAIRALAVSLLGERLGADDALVAFLERETEGNAYFAIEVVRALAEDAGRLDRISAEQLPSRVLPEGIRSVAGRRVRRIPESARPMLALAAVLGRRLDLEVLAAAAPGVDVEGWAALCGEAVVLEGAGYQWRFTHAKVREAVLAELQPAERRELHRRIGEAIERVHGDSPEWIGALAHHWKGAGVAERAVGYLVRAAAQALASGLPREAVDLAVDAVRLLGVEIPEQPEYLGLAIGKEMGELARRLGGRAPAELISLPELSDQRAGTAIEILSLVEPAAFISQQLELFALAVLKSMSLTLEHGAGPKAPEVYATYAAVARTMTQDSRYAYEFSRLAMELDRRRGGVTAPVAFLHTWFINHWIHPVRSSLPLARAGSEAGFRAGDVLYGCFNAAAHVIYLAVAGVPLPEVVDAAERAREEIADRVYVASFHCRLERQLARALAGATAGPTELEGEPREGEPPLATILRSSNRNQIGYYTTALLRLHYHAGDWRGALRHAEEAARMRPSFEGEVVEMEYLLFHALAAVACAGAADPEEREALLRTAEEMRGRLAAAAAVCEANFHHRARLVEAELLRARGDAVGAGAAYREAAESAGRYGFMQHAALAHERAARFHAGSGRGEEARRALEAAVREYRAWGAAGKADALRSELDGPTPEPPLTPGG